MIYHDLNGHNTKLQRTVNARQNILQKAVELSNLRRYSWNELSKRHNFLSFTLDINV